MGALNDRSKGYQIDIRIFGTEGVLLLDIERERLVVRRDDGADTTVPISAGDGDYPAEAPFPAFIAICRGEPAENEMPGEAAARTVEVLDSAYRSAKSGQVEEIQ
jgi:predicted dehydrogenase